ncbi:MAG: hypothetical protein ACFFA0_15120 [Promethearchaeota archaeon]
MIDKQLFNLKYIEFYYSIMYRIEKIGEKKYYIKVLGTFPPSVAERFMKEFDKKLKKSKGYSVIIDGLDFILLNVESFEIILDYLRNKNTRLSKSAWIISKNPPLDKEIQILLDRAKSPKRKIVRNLDEAKEWIGIEEIIIESD